MGTVYPQLDPPQDKSLDTTKLLRLYSESIKRDLEVRLNRIEGQIRGIRGLIERDTYCDDVITQIASAQSALNGVAKILIAGHMRDCLINRIQKGDHEVIDELLITIQRLLKR